jgi:signal transduction histidine kinase
MNQVGDFFRKIFDASDFPPRWHCGHWSAFDGWFYIISDLSIWAAYYAIPIIILRYISKKQKQRFSKLYFLFAAFILACGSTHLLDVVMFWYPAYRFSALIRCATGVVSWVTVFYLIKLLPAALSLKTAEQLSQEVEQRERVEEQLKLNNQLLNEALDIARLGHWQWDVLHDRVIWADSTRKLFASGEAVPHMSYAQYLMHIHPDDREYVRLEIDKALRENVFPSFYHRIILPDGSVRTMFARGETIVNERGEIEKLIGTVQDITDRKNTENELLIKTQKLEASNVELQKFAFVASHDLREPLRKIITFSSMLETSLENGLNEQSRLYLGKIISASARMQMLIDDILDFSRLTVNADVFSKVSLTDIIAQTLNDMEVAIQKSEADIKVSPALPEIEGNASQLGQLFQNLLSNAIKFRKPGQPPVITVSGELIKGSQLPQGIEKNNNYNFSIPYRSGYFEDEMFCRLSIKDNGIGFDEAYLDKIFLIFQRLHSSSDYEGTGIGLAICKKVVDLHNGTITAHSAPGQGAEFIITLPLSQKLFTSAGEVNGARSTTVQQQE